MFYHTDTTYCDPNAIGCYSYTTVGFKKENSLENAFSVYPNPTTGNLMLHNETKGLCSLEIQNSLGQIILKQTVELGKTELDLSAYPKGLYFFRIANDNAVLVKKIVVE